MKKVIYNANNTHLYAMGAEPVSYSLKDIHTIAIQATPEMIGALSLEFQTELFYAGTDNNLPYFRFWAERDSDGETAKAYELGVRIDDWLIVLWDEIHVFHDKEFRHTFSFDVPREPVDNEYLPKGNHELRETPGGFGIKSGEVDPQGTTFVPPVSIPIGSPSPYKRDYSDEQLEALRAKLNGPIEPTPRAMFGDDVIERSKQFEGDGPNVETTD